MTEDELNQRDARRLSFLQRVADDTHHDPDETVDMWVVGEQLGWSRAEIRTVVHYLVEENLLQYMAIGGIISLTHQAVKELEATVGRPSQATELFTPLNIMYVGSMQNSQVQQGTNHSYQTGTLSAGDLDTMRDWVEEAHGRLNELGLDEEALEEFSSQVATLRAQLRSKQPNTTILRESGKTTRAILEGAAGNVAGGILLAKLMPLLGILGG